MIGMKKKIFLTLEVESDDEINLDDKYIEWDLRQEISCASNIYEIVYIKQEVIQKNDDEEMEG